MRTRCRRSGAGAAARRLPARVPGGLLRPERPGPGRGARRLARHPRRARPHLHGARRAARPASRPTSTTTAARRAATRARRWRVVEAIANNTRAIMILNTANRSALPFLDEHAVVEVPAIVGRSGPVPVAIGPTPPHAQALVSPDQGRRAHDDRGGAERLRRAGGAGARAAPAGAERQRRARASSTATASGSPTSRSASPDERRRRGHGDRVHGHHVHRPRVGARAPARSASPATSCARPAAAPSTRSAPPGSGSRAALAVPLGDDLDGRFIRAALERRGDRARHHGRAARTPTTVVMP